MSSHPTKSGLVSIVIPCFNAEKTISDAIHSAFEQSYGQRELIVVDDGSTDRTASMVKRYKNLVFVQTDTNRGASYARNQGTRLARGEYIQYLDADDCLANDALGMRVAALQDEHADVAYSDWREFETRDNGQRNYLETIEREMSDVSADPQVACATSFWAPPAALLYSRRIIDRIGGWHEGLPIIQDARFLFDAAYHGARFVRVPGVGAYYRTSNDRSLSRANKEKFILDVFRNATEIQSLWERPSGMTEERRLALEGSYLYAARELFMLDEGKFDLAIEKLGTVRTRRSINFPQVAQVLRTAFGIESARSIMKFAVSARQSVEGWGKLGKATGMGRPQANSS